MMATRVFISYRRDDSKYQARMIHAAFCQVIPRDHVFMDVDSIPPGANFRKILKDWVNQCEVLLALIGPGWIDASDPAKGRRLDNPSDFVRIEIGEALARDIPVVPVLIDGAPLPDIGLLPDDLKELVDRQAEFVEYRTFDADVERLIRKLRLDQGVGRTNSLQQSMPVRRLKAEAKQRADEEETACIWDVASGKEIAVLRGHDSYVNSAAFSPDGSRIVTASGDKTARIWDAVSAKEIAALRGHDNYVHSAAFSRDGSRIVTASWDKTVRIWRPSPQ